MNNYIFNNKVASFFAIIFSVFFVVTAVQAATTISTDISTGGALSVTGLSTLGNASTTIFSSYGPAYFGATATSTFTSTGALGISTTTPTENLTVTNPASTATFSLKSWGNSVGNGNIRFDLVNGDNIKYALQYSGSGNTVLKLQYNNATKWSIGPLGQLTLNGTNSSFANQFTVINADASQNILNAKNSSSQDVLFLTNSGSLVVGNVTSPTAQFQVATTTSNATTTAEFGKSGQNKGTCLVMYDATGAVQYITVQGGALVVSSTSCN